MLERTSTTLLVLRSIALIIKKKKKNKSLAYVEDSVNHMKQYWNMYHTASLDQCTRKGQKLTSMSQLTGSSRPLLVGELYIKEKQHGEAQRVTEQLCWSCSLNKKLSILTWHAPRGGLAGLYWGHYSQSALCSV